MGADGAEAGCDGCGWLRGSVGMALGIVVVENGGHGGWVSMDENAGTGGIVVDICDGVGERGAPGSAGAARWVQMGRRRGAMGVNGRGGAWARCWVSSSAIARAWGGHKGVRG
ncbi:hypothetical protein BDN71DRAFT_1432490 [Pleurotus eryngii]|uniref:Uncharacterized protein n=1 Tax=Pleurotus eryngii TaxID=5323 RepID=A0A9P6D5I0_PLEER|nr:hypothetical protein BDN71DRAFT_1432490 [Pleurotus eryngii]